MKQCPWCDYACVFKALSDTTRLRICDMISNREVCGCEILEKVHITQPTLSYHMKMLCESGLANSRKDGCWTRYSLNQTRMEEIQDFLSLLQSSEWQSSEHSG